MPSPTGPAGTSLGGGAGQGVLQVLGGGGQQTRALRIGGRLPASGEGQQRDGSLESGPQVGDVPVTGHPCFDSKHVSRALRWH